MHVINRWHDLVCTRVGVGVIRAAINGEPSVTALVAELGQRIGKWLVTVLDIGERLRNGLQITCGGIPASRHWLTLMRIERGVKPTS